MRGTDIDLCMSAPTLTAPRKVGIIVYGLLAGFAAAMAFTVASVFIVAFALWLLSYMNWEWSWPLGIAVAYYAFLPGLIVGTVVCWKVCRSGWRGGQVP